MCGKVVYVDCGLGVDGMGVGDGEFDASRGVGIFAKSRVAKICYFLHLRIE